MTLSSNNFNNDQPAQSSNAFANAAPSSGSSFAKETLAADNHVWGGDDVSGTVFGSDRSTYGDVYGAEPYGGYTHFKNRTDPPVISH